MGFAAERGGEWKRVHVRRAGNWATPYERKKRENYFPCLGWKLGGMRIRVWLYILVLLKVT